MAFYSQVWFWLFLIAVILFIIALIGYEFYSGGNIPVWIWALFFISLLMILLAFIIYAIIQGSIQQVIPVVQMPVEQQTVAIIPSPMMSYQVTQQECCPTEYTTPCNVTPYTVAPDTLYPPEYTP